MNKSTNMKKIFISLVFLIILQMGSQQAFSAISYSLDNKCNTSQLTVWVTPDANYSGATAVWTPAAFTISWPVALGSGLLGAVTNQNGFAFAAAGLVGTDGTNYYQSYSHTAITTLAMTSGVSYEVARIAMNGGGGVYGTLEIPISTNAWVVANNGQSTMMNSGGNQVVWPYSAYPISNIPLFAGIFWDGVSWCGGSGTNEQPGTADGTLTCYINGMGAQLTTPYTTPAVVNNLTINTTSQLTIMPGAALTVNLVTTINSADGLVVSANNTGSGSFKNNVTVANTVYGTGASAKVETWLKNTASVGDFQMHLIGPTVFDPSIAIPATTGPGYVRLGAFNMQVLGSYAYRYRESTNTWVNIWQPTDSVPRLGGITLGDTSGVSKTISLSGYLNTGSVFDPTLPAKWDPTITLGVGNGVYLFSNPWPCYMKLEAFYNDNSVTQRLGGNSFFYTWEHENGTYGTWYYDIDAEIWNGTGHIDLANGIINPGQGFFGQLNQTASQVRARADATDNERVHGLTPFLKTVPANTLRMLASGNNTQEELIINFRSTSTSGFDYRKDLEKWPSMYEEATQINTVSADQYLLTVNSLPLLDPGEMTNVPMDFKCGADGTYTITASQIESFESGTEIWLEDLQVGGEWYSLNDNPVYEFTASPNDEISRFIVHFFGPTGIDDNPQAEVNAIRIYGYAQDAFIVNRGKETIKEYVAYDMMGRELHRGSLPNSTVNKVWVGNVSGYYVMKVITREGRIYTDKVYITK
jgi:hypothetical protein